MGIFAFQDLGQTESYPGYVRQYSLYSFDVSKSKFLWKFGDYCLQKDYIGLTSLWQEVSILYGKSRMSYTRIDPAKGKMIYNYYGDNSPGIVTDGKYLCVLDCSNHVYNNRSKKVKLSCYLLPEFK